MDLRRWEVGLNLVLGAACLIAGLVIKDINYKLFLFLMSAIFILTNFRPRRA
jgi:hypothetical protein